MPQWLIALGSIVGLLTGIYTLWERFIKQRPSVWLSRDSRRGELNPGDQDMALVGSSVTPRVYAVANSANFDSLVDAILDDSSRRAGSRTSAENYAGRWQGLRLGSAARSCSSLLEKDKLHVVPSRAIVAGGEHP
jgi:hypothetical protein